MPHFTGWVMSSTKFDHPTALFITGTTGAGKSHFIKKTIENEGIKGVINNIFYFMPYMEAIDIQPLPHQKLFLMTGIPTQRWLTDVFKKDYANDSLIIIDDQWTECCNSNVARSLLTHSRRHDRVSLIFVSHSFYEPGTFSKIMR